MQKEGLQKWTRFVALEDTTSLPTETIEDLMADAVSADWTGGPVEILAPEVVPEFVAITARLLASYRREGDSRRARLYNTTTPALFRHGCAFGHALEALRDARRRGDLEAERDAHRHAKAVWLVILASVEDWR